jgi:hypothetical protein
MWFNLSSSTLVAALTKIFRVMANSFPPEFVECFSSKSTRKSYVTIRQHVVHLCDQFQSELRVLWNSKAIETPQVPRSCFNPAVIRPLTLVPIKRVLGVPLAKEVDELRAQL